MTMLLLLRMAMGMILLGGVSIAAVQEVDYEATNYYNGEYDANEGGLSSTYTDDDVDDDYVITGAKAGFFNVQFRTLNVQFYSSLYRQHICGSKTEILKYNSTTVAN